MEHLQEVRSVTDVRVENTYAAVALSIPDCSLCEMGIDDRLQFRFLFEALKSLYDFPVFEYKNGGNDRDAVLHRQIHFVGNIDFAHF